MASNFVAKGADTYDAFMGRWSRKLAQLFIDFAGLADGERVIEIGCGTGSLTFALPTRANVAAIEAIDYEAQFVEAARGRNKDPRINIQQGDACSLQFADGQFDRALSMLVLHFVPDADRAVSEMRRVVRPGGIAARQCGTISAASRAFECSGIRLLRSNRRPTPGAAPS